MTTIVLRRTLTAMLWRLALRYGLMLGRYALRWGVVLAALVWSAAWSVAGRLTARALQDGPVVLRATLRESRTAWTGFQARRAVHQETALVATPSLRYCGQCGTKATSGVEFCAGCGLLVAGAEAGLAPANLHPCPDCHTPTDRADYFCTACGAPWSEQARAVQPRPAAVEVAATLHTLAGLGGFILTLPISIITALALAGHPLLAGSVASVAVPVGMAVGVWGLAWLGFSLAAAQGLRRGRNWARVATLAVALLWSFTGLGALVALPLMLALLLPSVNTYFARRPLQQRARGVAPDALRLGGRTL